jgi:hypothetical protein
LFDSDIGERLHFLPRRDSKLLDKAGGGDAIAASDPARANPEFSSDGIPRLRSE